METGRQNQVLGRSRDGFFSCKGHPKTDFNGLPIGFHLTGGEVSDCTQLETSLPRFRGVLRDLVYDGCVMATSAAAGIMASTFHGTYPVASLAYSVGLTMLLAFLAVLLAKVAWLPSF